VRPDARLEITLADGDKLTVDVNRPNAAGESVFAEPPPRVVLVHGLTGSSDAYYLQRIAAKLNAEGFEVWRMNHRGAGPSGLTLSRGFAHAGRSADLEAVVRRAAADDGPGRVLIAAFSLSANMLLRWLGAKPHDDALAGGPPPPKALVGALAVCPPVDLEACARALAHPRNFWIDWYYTRRLIEVAHKMAAHWGEPPPTFPRRTDLYEFDGVYTAPRAGFRDRDDYYARCSAAAHVAGIEVPTTVLAADDDPIIPLASVTSPTYGPGVSLRVERGGGHMGFYAASATSHGDRHWLDAAVVAWAKSAANG
jgi:predicted alpha/beta-fold hydrolase